VRYDCTDLHDEVYVRKQSIGTTEVPNAVKCFGAEENSHIDQEIVRKSRSNIEVWDSADTTIEKFTASFYVLQRPG